MPLHERQAFESLAKGFRARVDAALAPPAAADDALGGPETAPASIDAHRQQRDAYAVTGEPPGPLVA